MTSVFFGRVRPRPTSRPATDQADPRPATRDPSKVLRSTIPRLDQWPSFEASPVPAPLTAIVAMTRRGIIGRDGDLPWRLSSDLRRFKTLTMGGTLIMGRKTYDSIGRPLPGRQTVVITGQPDWRPPPVNGRPIGDDAVRVAGNVDDAQSLLSGKANFVVGGASIYELFAEHCDRLWITWVLADLDGDTRLQWDLDRFRVTTSMRIPMTPRDQCPTTWECFQRR